MIKFFVPGVPVPKGSAKAFLNRKTNKIMVQQDNRDKQKPWASMIGLRAQELGLKPQTGPVSLRLEFIMPRPKGHYGTGKNAAILKPAFVDAQHIIKPDLDKLIRCVKDALSSIAWVDDCQVNLIPHLSKRYSDGPDDPSGVYIEISYQGGKQ